jgi:hypothetical protein
MDYNVGSAYKMSPETTAVGAVSSAVAAPIEIDGARLICFAEITDAIGPTAKTTHSRGAEILGPARGLAICQFAGDSQFHLFYCDEDWTVLTDTCHMTLDEAKDQAQFEYDGISKCWRWAQAA